MEDFQGPAARASAPLASSVKRMAGSAPRKKEAKEKLQKDRRQLQARRFWMKKRPLQQGREQRSQGRDLALEDGAGETALVPHSMPAKRQKKQQKSGEAIREPSGPRGRGGGDSRRAPGLPLV